MFHKNRHEKPERVVNTRRAPKNTRRHTVSMLRMFFKRNEIDAMLNGFAADRSKSPLICEICRARPVTVSLLA